MPFSEYRASLSSGGTHLDRLLIYSGKEGESVVKLCEIVMKCYTGWAEMARLAK
jgi:hypothetical protein